MNTTTIRVMPFHYVFNTFFMYSYFEVWQNVHEFLPSSYNLYGNKNIDIHKDLFYDKVISLTVM